MSLSGVILIQMIDYISFMVPSYISMKGQPIISRAEAVGGQGGVQVSLLSMTKHTTRTQSQSHLPPISFTLPAIWKASCFAQTCI